MAFWSAEELRRRISTSKIIDPFNPTRVKYGAYELSLGPEVFVTSSEYNTRLGLYPGSQVAIPPGQLALLLTDEVVDVPPDAIAFISIKAGAKFRGLLNVSGFHVDPGFKGRLKFSVYNAGSEPAILECGQPLFPIWFSSLDRTTAEVYTGRHQNQMSLSPDDIGSLQGVISSPGALKRRIDAVNKRVSRHEIYIWILVALAVGFLTQNCPQRGASERGSMKGEETRANG